MLEQETKYHQLSQEQLDNFSLDMNAAYARLKGMEDAINSKMHTEKLFPTRLKFYSVRIIVVKYFQKAWLHQKLTNKCVIIELN